MGGGGGRCLREGVGRGTDEGVRGQGGGGKSDRQTETETDRETENSNSNSKTLFYKACSLGSFKNLSNN